MNKIGTLTIVCMGTAALLNFVDAATHEVGSGQTYTTIQACLNAAGPGDTCNVHAGTYTEQLSLPVSGTFVNRITLRNNGSDEVTVQSASSPVVNLNGRSYWTITGIRFTYNGSGNSASIFHTITNNDYLTISNNSLTFASGSGGSTGAPLFIRNSDHLTISGNTIAVTTSTSGTDCADFLFASNLEVSGNTCYGNASEATGKLEDGFVVSGTTLNIENNILHDGWCYDCHPDAIVVQGDGDRADNHTANVTVWRNTVYNFTQGVYFDCIHNPLEGTNWIVNNIIYETSNFRYGGAANKMNAIVLDGEQVSGAAGYTINALVANNTIDAKQLHIYNARQVAGSNIVIKNNIFVNPPFTAIYMPSNGGVTMDYNYYSGGQNTPIKWGNTNYSLSSFKSATGQENNSRTGTVDLNADYTPKISSDSRSFGLNLSSIFTVDKAGQARPTGSTAWDIGAYEYTANPGIQIQSQNNGNKGTVGFFGFNKLSFQKNVNAVVYSLAGKKVSVNSMKENGIYFVRRVQNAKLQKVLIVK